MDCIQILTLMIHARKSLLGCAYRHIPLFYFVFDDEFSIADFANGPTLEPIHRKNSRFTFIETLFATTIRAERTHINTTISTGETLIVVLIDTRRPVHSKDQIVLLVEEVLLSDAELLHLQTHY